MSPARSHIASKALDTETQPYRIEIRNESDVVATRSAARNILTHMGGSMIDKTRIATAVSELARNTLVHGGGGHMEMEIVQKEGAVGIRCVFLDEGPGIPDVEKAMENGFSTVGTLGHGLPGAEQLADFLKVDSEAGKGTRVEIIKWV